jgi:hypothetical protein
MRRQHRPPPGRQAPAGQFDLFGLPKALRPAPGLTWQQLPEEARETVIRLMARLLSGHESGERRPCSPGGRRDV